MIRSLSVKTLGLLLAGGLAVVAWAADPKPPEPSKPDPAGDSVERLSQAYSLAQYGRDNKVPEALITAAGLLRRAPLAKAVDKSDLETRNDKDEVVKPDNQPVKGFDLLEPAEQLLKDAKKLANDLRADMKFSVEEQAAVELLANREQKAIDKMKADAAKGTDTRGAVDGVHFYRNAIAPNNWDVYKVKFRPGQVARVLVENAGPVPLYFEVRDPDNNHVFSGTSYTPGGAWVPTYAVNRNYILKIKNVGNVKTVYQLVTN